MVGQVRRVLASPGEPRYGLVRHGLAVRVGLVQVCFGVVGHGMSRFGSYGGVLLVRFRYGKVGYGRLLETT